MCRSESWHPLQLLPTQRGWGKEMNRTQLGAALAAVQCEEAPWAEDVVLEGQGRKHLAPHRFLYLQSRPCWGQEGAGNSLSSRVCAPLSLLRSRCFKPLCLFCVSLVFVSFRLLQEIAISCLLLSSMPL